jgi:hypothetical protein
LAGVSASRSGGPAHMDELKTTETEVVRKSWPGALGSIAVNFIGEPQAVHCGRFHALN